MCFFMKKFLLVAMAALALVGCKSKQSELDFDDVAGKAVVQGYVYVDKGYVKDGDNYIKSDVPVEGLQVVVKVAYSEYDANAGAGTKIFEGTCDANGFYSIEIPVGQKAINNAEVCVRPFSGEYSKLINGNIQVVQVAYPESSTFVEIENGKTYRANNIMVAYDNEVPNASRQQKVDMTGWVWQTYEKRSYIDNNDKTLGYKVERDLQDAADAVVVVTVTSITDNRELRYEVKTNNEGTYSLSLALYDDWSITDVNVVTRVKAAKGSVTHYYTKLIDKDFGEWGVLHKEQQTVSGVFQSDSNYRMLKEEDALLGFRMPSMTQTFEPDYDNEVIYGIGDDYYDYDENGVQIYKSTNPLGWRYTY